MAPNVKHGSAAIDLVARFVSAPRTPRAWGGREGERERERAQQTEREREEAEETAPPRVLHAGHALTTRRSLLRVLVCWGAVSATFPGEIPHARIAAASFEFAYTRPGTGASGPEHAVRHKTGSKLANTNTSAHDQAGAYSIGTIKKAFGIPADLKATNDSTLQMVWGPGALLLTPPSASRQSRQATNVHGNRRATITAWPARSACPRDGPVHTLRTRSLRDGTRTRCRARADTHSPCCVAVCRDLWLL